MSAPVKTLPGVSGVVLRALAEVGQEVLDKYELVAGDAILAEEKHLPHFGEMINLSKVHTWLGCRPEHHLCGSVDAAAGWISRLRGLHGAG